MKHTDNKTWKVVAEIVMALLSILALLPFLLLFISSITDNTWATANGFSFFPKKLSMLAYQYIINQWATIGHAYLMTFITTVVGTVISVLITTGFAYALATKGLPFRGLLNFLCIFTMLFSGGMIPGYLLIKNMHLIDNRWSLILPGLISAYNIIIMRSFFSTIPESLEESARLDGANDVTIFAKIVLPLSKASIATIALFTAVGYWNDYFSSVLYINTKSRWSLQAVLRYMLTNTNQAMQSAGVTVTATTNVTAATIKAASVVVATVPILCVYPFVQKYFVKGVMIGGVKG